MAKSKNGGTRAMIRGRVGSDVYSIGKDGEGNKQQVVRSLAEQVANPQTVAQMKGRMIMSTVMQAVSAMAALIDHSFDGLTAGQPSISEFIRRNYALVKADVDANPDGGNQFGINQYQEKGIKQGAYIVADGKAAAINGVAFVTSGSVLSIALAASSTMADLLTALGITRNDYFTACAITATGDFVYRRFHIAADMADDTVITAANAAQVFTTEGNAAVAIAYASNALTLTITGFTSNYGIIVSRKADSGYTHNTCVLALTGAPAYTANEALPTYPIGTQRFLNGGEQSANLSAESMTFEAHYVDENNTEQTASVKIVGLRTATMQAYAQGESSATLKTTENALVAYDENGNNWFIMVRDTNSRYFGQNYIVNGGYIDNASATAATDDAGLKAIYVNPWGSGDGWNFLVSKGLSYKSAIIQG